jgi:hypothetical protein
MPLIQSNKLREAHFSELRCQGEKLQVILAKKHLKRGEKENPLLHCIEDKITYLGGVGKT